MNLKNAKAYIDQVPDHSDFPTEPVLQNKHKPLLWNQSEANGQARNLSPGAHASLGEYLRTGCLITRSVLRQKTRTIDDSRIRKTDNPATIRIDMYPNIKNPKPKPHVASLKAGHREPSRQAQYSKAMRETYCDSCKQYLLYILLLIWTIILIPFELLYITLYYIFCYLVAALTLVLKLVVSVVLAIFFCLTFWVPHIRNSPFKTRIHSERIEIVDRMTSQRRTLFLDLDNTLVYASNKRPSNWVHASFELPSAGQDSIETIYVVRRPHLERFLQAVS